MFYVIKKDGTKQEWNLDKVEAAIKKSAARTTRPLSEDEIYEVLALVENALIERGISTVPISWIHSQVIEALKEVREDVAYSYRTYRAFKENAEKEMHEIEEECQGIMFLGDKSNANADSAIVSTKRAKQLHILEKKLYKNQFLLPAEKQALKDGYIYVHDMDSRRESMNCCLFDVDKVLKGGFEMSNTRYTEPKTLSTAFDVVGDITMMAASQQYGGFTIPEVDKILAPYAEKSYQKYVKKYTDRCGLDKDKAALLAKEDVLTDMRQGFQGWEMKFNTVASSRGDFPFITATFGIADDMWGRELSKAILAVRKEGQGEAGKKKAVLFPKLVFLYDEKLHGKGGKLEDVFETAVDSTLECMYPDYLSLNGHGYVPEMYQKYGKVVSPMGCRAFLSPWYEKGGMYPADENDVPVFTGRFNIGVVSLNLPMILQKSRMCGTQFYEELDYYLEMIRQIHLRTYEYLGNMKASMNPLAFCEGGFYGGNLDYNDKIAPVLISATASFGITALNELQQLYDKRSLSQADEEYLNMLGILDDGTADLLHKMEYTPGKFFALDVLAYINHKITEFKKEDHRLYAIYGTPAESLSQTQVIQFRKKYGIVENVSDKEYVSNSFHVHVTENLSPIQKQSREFIFWDLSNGGKIQHVGIECNYNKEAVKTIIRRGMELGLYQGINFSRDYCDDCGYKQIDMGNTCPKCGSGNLTKINRMNGYLAFSRIKGDTRLNDGKMAEIRDRVCM